MNEIVEEKVVKDEPVVNEIAEEEAMKEEPAAEDMVRSDEEIEPSSMEEEVETETILSDTEARPVLMLKKWTLQRLQMLRASL